MSSEFSILLIQDSKYQGIIVCNNYYYPTEYVRELNLELRQVGAKGFFLIDLLLVNGTGSNRFAQCFFDGEKVDLRSIKTVDGVSGEVKMAVTEYFYRNYSVVENSILTRAVKFKIKKKLAA